MSTIMSKQKNRIAPLNANAAPAGVAPAPGLLNNIQSEVSVEAAPLLGFIARNSAMIMTLLALFVLLVVGVGAWQWYADKRDTDAQMQLARLLVLPQGTARLTALSDFAAKAPDSVLPATLAELGLSALNAGEAEKAATSYERLAQLQNNTALGILARFAQAQSLSAAHKYDQALAVLEQMENTVSEGLRPQVRTLLALAAEQAQKPARAITAYEALLAGASGENADFYRFQLQRLKASSPK